MENAIKIRYMLPAILALMAGCYENPSDDSASSDESEDTAKPIGIPNMLPHMITDEGVAIYWESELDPAAAMKIETSTIDQWWIETQQCLGLEAEAPIVRITDDLQSICENSDSELGTFCLGMDPAPIVLHVGATINPRWNVAEDRLIWKHEFTHYIGYKNDKPELLAHDGLEDTAPHWQCQWN